MNFEEFTSPEFLKQLPDDPATAVFALASAFQSAFHQSAQQSDENALYGYALIYSFVKQRASHLFELARLDGPVPRENMMRAISELQSRADTLLRKAKMDRIFEESEAKFLPLFGRTIVFELSDDQLANIQRLLNELRNVISAADESHVDADHKQRLMGKLEALQRELHKKMTTFDKFWGFVAEARSYLPRVREVTELGHALANVMSTAHGHKALPATQFFLPDAPPAHTPKHKKPSPKKKK